MTDTAPSGPVLLSWSSGKDSAWTLRELLARGHEVVGLLTTVNASADRVAMHAVRSELLRRQAEAAGLPLWTAEIPSPCSNADYEDAMGRVVDRARAAGIATMAFGDLFLEDIRRYREDKLEGTGLTPIFPLWQRPTEALARTMLAAGLKAVVTCVDPRQVPAELCGRPYDEAFLEALPEGADPCGENGEFHTFVWDGPMFRHPVPIEPGEVVEREGFVYADVLPRG
ncbi:MAG: adenine nucleotide alpha hydrolase [Planctomycetes bacterium]|nr:adenine nucleotide alpha hydrolase [Planctomycetota bacterium]